MRGDSEHAHAREVAIGIAECICWDLGPLKDGYVCDSALSRDAKDALQTMHIRKEFRHFSGVKHRVCNSLSFKNRPCKLPF